MRIRFETTIEDIIAFNRFHCENSPMWRRQRFAMSMLMVFVFLIAVCAVLSLNFRRIESIVEGPFGVATLAGLAVVTVILSVSVFYYMRWRTTASVVSSVRKLLAEGTNRSITGWREMELVNNRLIVKLELIDTSYDLRAIEKIISDDRYTYVYVSSIQAFMIPMTFYPEEEYRQFVADLLDAWENRDVPRPEVWPADDRIIEGLV